MAMLNQYFKKKDLYREKYGEKTLLLFQVGAFYEVYTKVEKNSKEILYKQLSTNSEVAKISVIGMGMMSQSGVAEKMFQTLADQQINILAISTSEIKISVLIEKKYTEKALNSLHSAYRLGINN